VKPIGRREPLIDALRASALLGVAVVNLQAYPTGPWGSPLGVPAPADSPLAWTVFGMVAWLLQGKAYPLLAFLFGYSLALALRSRGTESARRRLYRLLALGVLHGALLYAGDVLTLYALCGLLLLTQAHVRLRKLLRQLRVWFVFALIALALSAWILTEVRFDTVSLPSYPQVRGAGGLVALNARVYVEALVGGVLLFGPEIMMLMSAGFIAGRVGLLTRERWRPDVARVARWALPLGLVANAVYAAAATAVSIGSDATRPWPGLVGPVGWLLTVGFATALATAWHAGPPALLRALVPLGRYTLSLYVGVSLLGALLISGAGAGWALGSAGLALVALLTWALAALAARYAMAAGWRGPLEAWMTRR